MQEAGSRMLEVYEFQAKVIPDGMLVVPEACVFKLIPQSVDCWIREVMTS